MSLFHPSQPAAQAKFRQFTEGQRKMAGCTLPSFRCRTCLEHKPVKGRRLHPEGGYECEGCAPRPQDPAVAVSRRSPKVSPPKPAQAASKGRQTLLTDAQVLECRAAYEFASVKPATLARYYHVSVRYMNNMLGYQTRSKLIPQQPDAVQLQAFRSLFCDPAAPWRNER